MAVKQLLLTLLCVTFTLNCQSKWTTWVKLNANPVCFGAQGNKFGAFTPGKNAFIWAFMLKHLSGSVTCSKTSDNRRNSPWGCDPNKEVVTFLTDERNNIIGPRFAQLSPAKTSFVLPGYHSSSPYLIFFMGKSAYGLHHMAELRLWYGEDLQDISESDNGGRSCADVYGLM